MGKGKELAISLFLELFHLVNQNLQMLLAP
jgi:hypothetical protein